MTFQAVILFNFMEILNMKMSLNQTRPDQRIDLHWTWTRPELDNMTFLRW